MRWLTVTLLVLLLFCTRVSAIDIPDFTPNVVDPAGHLDDSARQTVNDELKAIRERSHIWGAVFIVDTLDGESIEAVANEAFQKWQLGQKGVDNGLLLVLAIKDRKSRFEVGYGLEGTITDVVSLHALDSRLAPRMREGDTAGAIVDSFEYLSKVVEKDPDAVRELAPPDSSDEMHWKRGLIAWGVMLAAVWLCFPIRNRWVDNRRARLLRLDPSLQLADEGIVNAGSGKRGAALPSATTAWKGNWILQAFLSVNPGVFVLMLSAWLLVVFYISIGATLLISFLIVYLSARRYGSPESYRAFLESLASKRARLIQRGFVEEREPGIFAYTPAYFESQKSSSSDASSSWSSSDSSDSSSGGGSSGGGGASSGW